MRSKGRDGATSIDDICNRLGRQRGMETGAEYYGRESLGARFRRRRFRFVAALIRRALNERGKCDILDIGGTEYYWRIAGDLVDSDGLTVTLVNLDSAPVGRANFTSVSGDACDLSEYSDQSFDIVHANSVIEHVGDSERMRAMADEVRRVGRAYYIQTPYYWFPIEPHFRAVGFHWLPASIRARWIMAVNLGFREKAKDFQSALREVESVRLINQRQLRTLFPDAEIKREWLPPFVKSIMAVRGNVRD